MICPRCGSPNEDSAPECSQCLYKFRQYYGYDDPGMATPLTSARLIKHAAEQSGPQGLVFRIIMLLVALVLLLLLIAPTVRGILS